MAFYLNQFHCIGNLVVDPELKQVGSDKKVCKLRIAVNNPHNENVLYFYVDVWNKEGEKCMLLKKGSEVFITNASIIPKQYKKTSQSGDEYTITTFTVNVDGYCGKVQFGSKKNSEKNTPQKKSTKTKEVEEQQVEQEDENDFDPDFEW